MSAADEIKRDAMKALASSYAMPVIKVFVVLCLLVLAYGHGRRSVVTDQKVAAARDTIRITDSIRIVVRDTVRTREKATAVAVAAKEKVDAALPVLAALPEPVTPLTVRDTLFVPPVVLHRIEVDSILIVAQAREIDARRLQATADSAALAARDRLLRLMKPSVCGRKCGVAIGVTGTLLVVRALH